MEYILQCIQNHGLCTGGSTCGIELRSSGEHAFSPIATRLFKKIVDTGEILRSTLDSIFFIMNNPPRCREIRIVLSARRNVMSQCIYRE